MSAHQRLEAALDAFRDAQAALCSAARDYAREQVQAYSATHPRREVQFVAAMGSTCLHVQRGGAQNWKGAPDYQISAGSQEIGPALDWLAFLDEIEEETRIPTPAGTVAIICKGGSILSETEAW